MLQHHNTSVDYYDAIEEYLIESDLVETDVHVTGLKKKFRIRALSFEKQEEVNQKSTDKDGNLNHLEWVLWTLVHGIVRPVVTYAQAKQLLSKNGQVISTLADEIWNIGRIPKQVFDDYIAKLKELSDVEKELEEKRKK